MSGGKGTTDVKLDSIDATWKTKGYPEDDQTQGGQLSLSCELTDANYIKTNEIIQVQLLIIR